MQIRPVATLVDSDATASPGIDLLWIPLGSGGSGFVDLNGRIYEAIKAYQDRRPPVHPVSHRPAGPRSRRTFYRRDRMAKP